MAVSAGTLTIPGRMHVRLDDFIGVWHRFRPNADLLEVNEGDRIEAVKIPPNASSDFLDLFLTCLSWRSQCFRRYAVRLYDLKGIVEGIKYTENGKPVAVIAAAEGRFLAYLNDLEY